MDLYALKGLFAFVAIVVLLIIGKNIISMITKRNFKLDNKRQKELNFEKKRTSSQDMSTAGLIDTVTSPVRKYILPKV